MTYHRPHNIQDACLLAARPGARIVAGGTDLMVRVEKGIEEPQFWVDISHLPLHDVRLEAETQVLEVGALCTMALCASHTQVLQHAPLLAQAAVVVGAPGIRNRATIGGNLANASPAADVSCALMALNAELVIISGQGRRSLPIQEFFLSPGRSALVHGEILAAVRIPLHKPEHTVRTLSHWFKAGNRRAQVISMVAVAARTHLDANDRVLSSAIAVASVAPRPLRLSHVEAMLLDAQLTPDVIARAAAAAAAEITPISDVRASAEYRRHLTSIFTQWHLEDQEAGSAPKAGRMAPPEPPAPVVMDATGEGPWTLRINGRPVSVKAPGSRRLLDVLREDLHLTGTKNGCGEGECGACMVLVDGRPVNACLVALGSVAGHDLTTVEGLSEGDAPGTVQQAFIDAGAVQCGFCIPGCEITAQALVDEEELTRDEIAQALSGNLCRCTGYVKIIDAVALALSRRAEKKKGGR
ncbi:FAD binding domain-containing protein [Myxococcota bacterium]|nr:FAD binding domain-containing protein [Myxococcota bacterium]MBU1413379.1 FAD binding domain-containing protein [Myxococcota bacterium]MBU1508979.1 FAD binding domain-containing protein [Myxococcota bacterium]